MSPSSSAPSRSERNQRIVKKKLKRSSRHLMTIGKKEMLLKGSEKIIIDTVKRCDISDYFRRPRFSEDGEASVPLRMEL